jgi:hypothetical protein
MNVLRKQILKSSNKYSLYSVLVKGKFRRSFQPGLSRYNTDEYDHQNGSMNVRKIQII